MLRITPALLLFTRQFGDLTLNMPPLSGIHTKKVTLTTWKRYNAGLPNFFKTFHIYPERLAALNLPTLEYRRIREDMIKTFKIPSNIYDSRITNFLSKSTFQQQEDITSSCLYNVQTSTSENHSSQPVLSTSGIVFSQML